MFDAIESGDLTVDMASVGCSLLVAEGCGTR